VAALTIANAMVFQEVLAASDGRVQPLRTSLSAPNPVTALANHWDYIEQNIDYVPIFAVARRLLLALPADSSVEAAVQTLAAQSLLIVSRKAALRHDLMGRVYHRLLSEAKYLGTYYTSVPAATLLLKYTMNPKRWNIDWSDLAQVASFRVGDLACGTGTLLMASAEAIADDHVQAGMRSGRAPDLVQLHKLLMEDVIIGLDVLTSALHLTASTLALRASAVAFDKTNLYAVPLGGPHHSLGSIEFLAGSNVITLQDIFGGSAATGRVTGTGDETVEGEALSDLDLCVMNPPFTRSVGGNLLFGSLPEAERTPMRERLARLLRSPSVRASSVAGLGAVFVAVGDTLLKPGGTMALVLGKQLLSGISWEPTRALLSDNYLVELIVASHDPERWNFSDNTDLSEVLLVARKRLPTDSAAGHRVTALNLAYNPRTAAEALQVAQALTHGNVPPLEGGQGALEIRSRNLLIGQAVTFAWDDLRVTSTRPHQSWMPPCAFAQTDVTRAAYHLERGDLNYPGLGVVGSIALTTLGSLGSLGPDRRDIMDGFDPVDTPTAYPAVWGGAEGGVTGLSRAVDKYLAPLAAARPNRNLRNVNLLWPRAGRVIIAEGLRLNTQGVVACYVGQPVLSNVWWPFKFNTPDEAKEKALVMWLNSTLALILMLATREETEGAWVGFKKPTLGELKVLDVDALHPNQLASLSHDYDQIDDLPLQPFPVMATDNVRKQIDDILAAALGIPAPDTLREMLAREPVISNAPLY
jgi:hypothetical protein